MPNRLVLSLIALCAALSLFPSNAHAQLSVLMSGGFVGASAELMPAFTKATGITVTTARAPSQGDNPNTIGRQIARGVPADVVILSREGLDEIAADGHIASGTAVGLGQAPLAVAVPAGRPKPEIGTVAAFRQALLQAKTVTFQSTTLLYMKNTLLPRLGIADAVLPKVTQEGPAGVAQGAIELGVSPTSELLNVPGLDDVGPIPAELQLVQVFSAGVVQNCAHPDAARELIAFLRSAAAQPVLRRHGLDAVAAGG